MRRAAALVLLAGLLPASATHAHASTGADPVTREWPQWPYRVSCGAGAFDPIATFSAPARAERGRRHPARVLRRFLEEGLLPWLPRNNWRSAIAKPGELQFLHGHPGAEIESGKELQWLRLRHKRGRWRMSGYSASCRLTSIAEGKWATTWHLADDQPEPAPETRQVKIYVGAPCSVEEEPAALAKPPQFTEISGKLVMAIWLRPGRSQGRTVCEEGLAPGPPLTVELPAPLGDRELVDGGTFPPNPASHLTKPKGKGVPLRPVQAISRSALLRQ